MGEISTFQHRDVNCNFFGKGSVLGSKMKNEKKCDHAPNSAIVLLVNFLLEMKVPIYTMM